MDHELEVMANDMHMNPGEQTSQRPSARRMALFFGNMAQEAKTRQ